MFQLILIGFRNLVQHRIRTLFVLGAVAAVTATVITLAGISTGVRNTLLVSATTLTSGHVNVAGFYKVTASQSAPVVTGYQKILELVREKVPGLDYVIHRGRGWARVISEESSMQLGIGGIDIRNEPGFKRVVKIEAGNVDDLSRPDGLLVFHDQADRLKVKVGDKVTIAAPTFRGTNNTIDLTVVAIATDVGLLSSFNVFMNEVGLRQLYQLNDETTGAVQLYLKDIKTSPQVVAALRSALVAEGYSLMDPDDRPFWQKFDSVNREDWTGQRLDLTTWEGEVSFMKWILDGVSFLFFAVILVMMIVVLVGIGMVMWVTIRERTREIGTLRAIGMQANRVRAMFTIEGFLIGLVGTLAGVAGGLAMAAGLNASRVSFPGMQVVLLADHLVVTPTVFWSLFSIGVITSLITLVSLIPSSIAARLSPIDAMSHIG